MAGPRHCQLFVTGPLDGLSLRIKLATYGGVFLGSPVILWELWRFITPGLHSNEKRYAIPFVVSSILLFVFGAYLAFVSFPHALQFLQSVGGPSLQQIYDPNKYLGLIVALMAVFGLTFEFPVILVSLELVGRVVAEEAVVVAPVGHRPHRGVRGRHHTQRGPVLHAGVGGAHVPLLRGVDRDRPVPAPLSRRRR